MSENTEPTAEIAQVADHCPVCGSSNITLPIGITWTKCRGCGASWNAAARMEPECLSGADARMAAEDAPSGAFAYVEHEDGTWAPMMKQPDDTWACGQDTDHRAHSHRLDGDRIVLVNSAAEAEVAGLIIRPG